VLVVIATGVGRTTADLAARDAASVADALKIRYTPFVLARGEGTRLFDPEGRRFLDFSALWSVAHLGYSNERVRTAVTAQLERTMCSTAVSTLNEPAIELAERLAALVPGDQMKSWFGLSGSDAAEAAQRLVRRATGKPRLVSFTGSWHGTTDAVMALSGHAAFADADQLKHVAKVPYPDPYRPPFDVSSDELVDRCLEAVDWELARGDVAAVFVEGVQADSGDIVPPADFLPKLRALCDRHGALLVFDEVKVGLGRTGKMFSFDHAGVRPDLVLLGKSLGGGLALSAVIGPAEVLDVGTGIALYTISGNATACAAGLATLEVVQEERLAERAAETGAYLLVQLDTLRRHEMVGDVRGLGMICGVDLVSDRTTKAPDQRTAAKVVYRAWQLGLILFYAGSAGNVLEITPPLILTRDEVDGGVAILDQAMADVANGAVSDEEIAPYAGW
jgi:4-aminobutyrate aminotransferase